MDMDMEECEGVKMEEENFSEKEDYNAVTFLLRCRSIRIGSYKVYPLGSSTYVDVTLTENNLAFDAPIISDLNKLVHITLAYEDVRKIYIHFGNSLPVMFIRTTSQFGQLLSKFLQRNSNKTPFFDPSSKDDKKQKLTFLMESLTEEQSDFIRCLFFAGVNKKIVEIDQKTASEILVRSTPNQEIDFFNEDQESRPRAQASRPRGSPIKGITVESNDVSRSKVTSEKDLAAATSKENSVSSSKGYATHQFVREQGKHRYELLLEYMMKLSESRPVKKETPPIVVDLTADNDKLLSCSRPFSEDRLEKPLDECRFNLRNMIAQITENVHNPISQRDAKATQQKFEIPENVLAEMDCKDNFPELTPKMEAIVAAILQRDCGNDTDLVTWYDDIPLLRKELRTLNNESWLMDEVLNCYLKLLRKRSKLEKYPSMYCFNSFFYASLSRDPTSKSIKRWSRNKDIFSYDLLFFPICLNNVHWALCVVDNRDKTVKFYDSMRLNRHEQVTVPIRNYLIAEMLNKKGITIQPDEYTCISVKNLPQQENGSDCGMFTLKYAECITRDAPITFNQYHIPYFRRRVVWALIKHEYRLPTYSAPSVMGTAITISDFHCLDNKKFLNDTIIDFYLRYLFDEKILPYYKRRTHIFNCFFFSSIHGSHYSEVIKWTKHVDIFSKDFLIVPVNQYSHWCLAIVCYASRVPDREDSDNNSMNTSESSPNDVMDYEECVKNVDSTTNPDGKQIKEMPCISIFDSYLNYEEGLLRGVKVGKVLREYLDEDWKRKNGGNKLFNENTLPVFVRKCPQQSNTYDCGIYLLQFVESFFKNPIEFCNPTYDLTDWFTEETTNRKRKQLKDLILKLQGKQSLLLAAISHHHGTCSTSTVCENI